MEEKFIVRPLPLSQSFYFYNPTPLTLQADLGRLAMVSPDVHTATKHSSGIVPNVEFVDAQTTWATPAFNQKPCPERN